MRIKVVISIDFENPAGIHFLFRRFFLNSGPRCQYFLCYSLEKFYDSCSCLCTSAYMLTSYSSCIAKRLITLNFIDILMALPYFSASSRGIILLDISHLFPAMIIGVSLGRYFLSSLIQILTLVKESWSVISYTIKAPIRRYSSLYLFIKIIIDVQHIRFRKRHSL